MVDITVKCKYCGAISKAKKGLPDAFTGVETSEIALCDCKDAWEAWQKRQALAAEKRENAKQKVIGKFLKKGKRE